MEKENWSDIRIVRDDYPGDNTIIVADQRDVNIRYNEVCRRSLPKLEVSEWYLICDSLNGCGHTAQCISFIEHGIEDSMVLDNLDVKWGVSGEALIAKLKKLTYAEKLAVVNIAEQYWEAGKKHFLMPGETP